MARPQLEWPDVRESSSNARDERGLGMARIAVCAGWLVAMAAVGVTRGDEGVLLREDAPGAARVLIEMKADGESRPELPPGSPKDAPAPKPIPLKIESRLDFIERGIKRDADGSARKSARRVVEA